MVSIMLDIVVVGELISFSLVHLCNMVVKIIGRPAEGLGTEHTTIGCNLVTVRAAEMFVKMRFLSEPIETQDALERSLTRVSAKMN